MKNKERIQAAYNKSTLRRWTAFLLCAALVSGMVSSALPALAVGDGEKETYCEHHPEHTEECGYVEAVEGQDCIHEHDENCGYTEGQDCTHEHDESCGYAEGQDCTHEHGDECGYAEGQDCAHEHDEYCGYVEVVEGQPCRYVCGICEGLEEEGEQGAILSADESIATAAAQEEGLIAHFTFNDSNDRLKDSSGRGVTASLRKVTNRLPGVEDVIVNVSDYFDDVEPDALLLSDNACLELEETEDFDKITEMTVEMKIRIIERGDGEDKGVGNGKDSHWLFYAAQPEGVTAKEKCLGVVLTGEKKLRILRQKEVSQGEYGEAEFPAGFNINDWNTIRIIYKPSNIALYVNNIRIVDKGLGNMTSEYFAKGRKIWFGHSAWNDDPNFKGYIDEIKIYNYANYDKPGGGYLDGYINEQEHIVESADPPNTTVHMFDYWITKQLLNDYDPRNPQLSLEQVREGGINKGHLLLFAGYNAAVGGLADSDSAVGSWNSYTYKKGENHQSWEPFPGIVDNVLEGGYPKLAIEGLKKSDMFKSPDGDWYDRNADRADESLAYLFDPDMCSDGKASYRNVTGLFRLDKKGNYYFKCAKTFAELNSDQSERPKKTTGNNRITLYERKTDYKDFFPFNDATDVFYIDMTGNLDKANGGNKGMGVQSTTDEPFNHYFGMTVETTFEQTADGKIDLPGGKEEDMMFYFSGDDDVWIFIDDVLVADVGGIHNELDVNINFATGKIDYTGHNGNGERQLDGSDADGSVDADGNKKKFDTTLKEMFVKAGRYDESKWNPNNKELFADGSKHTLKFFYLERGNAASRCTIEFNLQHVDDNSTNKSSEKEKTPEEWLPEEIVTLNVTTELPKKNDKAVPAGVLESPDTGDSNMVGLWFTLLVFSTVGIIAVYRTRKHKNK